MSNMRFLVGSVMLRLNNTRDTDIISEHKISQLAKMVEEFIHGRNHERDCYKGLFIYQLSNGFHSDSEYPLQDFNILKLRTIWVSHLQAYVNALPLNGLAKKKYLPKEYYHLLYQYYMIIENTHYISAEGLAEVQKIHDLEVPGSYIYHIRDLINSLTTAG